MKLHRFIAIACAACTVLFAENAAPQGAHADCLNAFGENVKPADLAAMEKFLAMPPEKMRGVIAALEKIAAMPDEQREELRARVRAFRLMNDERRLNLLYEFRHTSPRARDMVKRYINSLPPEERESVRKEFFDPKRKGPERVERHKALLEKAKAAGIAPDETLSDVVGADIPKRLKDHPRPPKDKDGARANGAAGAGNPPPPPEKAP